MTKPATKSATPQDRLTRICNAMIATFNEHSEKRGTDPKRGRMFLDMCFPYGVDASVACGDGNILALRLTEGQENAV